MSTKLEYVSRNKQFRVTFEVKDSKELFEQLSAFQEIYESNNVCKCGGSNVNFNVRDVEDNKFYEKVCLDCGFKFAYGQHKKGNTLFPNNTKGWHKWTPADNDEEVPLTKDAFAPKPKRVKG